MWDALTGRVGPEQQDGGQEMPQMVSQTGHPAEGSQSV